jgi:diguanylate cyclase (GGDEF)-like protein/PAS domain S-box-containing protein
VSRGFVARFVQAHLWDYPRSAAALWLGLLAGGAAALAWALAQLWGHTHEAALALLAAAAAGIASLHPVRIARSTYSLSTADICTYLALAALGPPAAVLAAGTDAACGAWRMSQRISSRIASPAAAMAATAIAGAAFEAALPHASAAFGAEAALLAALGAAALIVFGGTTLPLTSMMALKNGQRVSLGHWFSGCAWVGAMMLTAALLAALVTLNARLFGIGLIAIAGVVVAAAIALLRVSMARQEADQAEQDRSLALARRAAEANQQRFTAAFSHAAVGMAIVGADQRTLQVNRALSQLLGHEEAALVGRDFKRFLHPGDVPLLERLLRNVADRPGETFTVQLRCQRGDGEELWVALHCSPFEDPAGDTADRGRCVIYQLHDITSRHLAEQRLHHIAFHDSLTDLANRACFIERLSLAVERSRTEHDARFAVLFLDLDRFKIVNDSLGHQAGNELLCGVAARLRASVRPRDLVARLGGDEFAVLCEGLEDPEHARQLAQRLSATLSAPLPIQGSQVVAHASIGITFSDLGYRTVDEILRDADLAMYEAKGAGLGRVAVFDSSMHERIAERLALEIDLRHAIGEGKLSAAFQPIFKLEGMSLAGFEALARWEHATRGPINPSLFIAVAEEAGHIEAVTRWMIEHSLGWLARWRAEHPGHGRLTMSVNVSGRDLANPELVQHVRAALLQHEVPPGLLTLEITETMLMNKLEASLVTLRALRELGVRLSIDDFGTGYSSLAYLATLPIDALKIDRSFVAGLRGDGFNAEIITTVLKLGHTLGKRVVAEGIETAEQLQRLQQLGVDSGQGYLLARPLAPERVGEVLLKHQPATA